MAEVEDGNIHMAQAVDERVLKDVVAFVEVRTASDNRSESVRKELEQLGAIVLKKFTDEVTHVIFKEGSNRTKVKALKKDVHLVSVLWVDHCKRYQEHVSERMFPADVSKTKGTPLLMGKMKKAKSMQPRDFHEQLADSAERVRRKRKRLETIQKMQYSDSTPSYSPRAAVLVQDTQPRSPDNEFVFTPVRLTIPDTPPGMREIKERQNRLKEIEGENVDIEAEAKQESLKYLQKKLFSESDGVEIQHGTADVNDVFILKYSASDQVNNEVLDIAYKIKESLANEILSQSGADSDENHLDLFSSDVGKHAAIHPSFSPVTTKSFTLIKENVGQTQTVTQAKTAAKTTNLRKSSRQKSPHIMNSIDSVKTESERTNEENTRPETGLKSTALIDNNNTQGSPDQLHLQLSTSPVIEYQTSCISLCTDTDTQNHSSIGNKENVKGRRKSKRFLKKSLVQVNNCNNGETKDLALDCSDTDKSKKEKKTTKKKLISLSDLMDRHSILIEPTKSTLEKRKQLICDDKQTKADKKESKRINCIDHTELSKDDKQAESEEVTGKKKKRKKKKRNDLEDLNSVEEKSSGKNEVRENRDLVSYNKMEVIADDSHVEEREILLTDNSIGGPLSNLTGQLNLTKDKSLTCSIRETTLSMSMSQAYPDCEMSSILASARQSIDEFSQKNIRKARNRVCSNRAFTSIRETGVSTARSSNADKGYKQSIFDVSGHRKKMRPSIVMTSLHSYEQDVVISVVKKLGEFVITDNVNETTTHVVCGEPRRTLNILHSLARGLWLVSKEWVIKSLEAGEWIPEEDFECVDYFPVCKVTRLEREACQHVYRQNLFTRCGLIYISGRSSPPRPQLLQLVKLCGGQVTGQLEKAAVFVGGDFHPGLTCVKTTWVLDCIKAHVTLPLEKYSLDRPKRESSPVY